MVALFKSLVLPRLEYGCQLWSPTSVNQINAIENIQRKFTKHITGMHSLPYENRLKHLKLYSLQRRRDRYIDICQSLHAKFDYIKSLIDKFAANNCPLQVLCLQESWFSSDTDLSPYMISGYHMISTGHYASNHGGLVIYLNDSWNYKLKSCQTDSHIWEKQIIEIFNPHDLKKKAIIIGNVYRPPYNSRDSYTTFSLEFNAMLLEYRSTSQTTYICGDYNIDLLKVNDLKFNEEYFHDI